MKSLHSLFSVRWSSREGWWGCYPGHLREVRTHSDRQAEQEELRAHQVICSFDWLFDHSSIYSFIHPVIHTVTRVENGQCHLILLDIEIPVNYTSNLIFICMIYKLWTTTMKLLTRWICGYKFTEKMKDCPVRQQPTT